MAPIAPGTGAVPSLCQVVRAAKWHADGQDHLGPTRRRARGRHGHEGLHHEHREHRRQERRVPLKVYTLYAPPNHRDGVVHQTRADAEADNEHFDGKTTE